jgi:hypothetical protein
MIAANRVLRQRGWFGPARLGRISCSGWTVALGTVCDVVPLVGEPRPGGAGAGGAAQRPQPQDLVRRRA